MWYLKACCTGLWLACTLLLSAQSIGNYHLRVQVLEESDRVPLQDALVQLEPNGKQAFSNESGLTSFQNLRSGKYQLQVMHAGCDTVHQSLQLTGDTLLVLLLHHQEIRIQEIEIKAQKQPTTATAPSTRIEGRALDLLKGNSLGEMLQKVNGLSVISTGNNISKPVIRGLHSNRILILQNEVRLESQQWGLEHAPEIDPMHAASVEVIKGPMGLRYGSDAMGGVILVNPGNIRATPGYLLKAQLQFNTANLGSRLALSAEGRSIRASSLGWRIFGSFRKEGHVRTPGYWMANTGMQEWNAGAMLQWKWKRVKLEGYYTRYETQLGIFSGAHIGNLTDLLETLRGNRKPPEAQAGYAIGRPYQQVSHDLLKLKAQIQLRRGELEWMASRQFNLRNEFDVRSYGSQQAGYQFSIQTYALSAVWKHRLRENLKLIIGWDGSTQTNNYRYAYFIPAFWNFNTGGFGNFLLNLNGWEVEGGLRLDYRWMQNVLRDETQPIRMFIAPSAALGIAKNIGQMRFSYHTGTAWRAPQPAELYAYGLEHGAGIFIEGKNDLKAEFNLQNSVGFTFDRKPVKLELEWFSNVLFHYIFAEPGTEPILTIRGAFPVYRYRQTTAALQGVEGNLTVQYLPWLSSKNSFSLSCGYDVAASNWLPLMPPFRWIHRINAEPVLGKKGMRLRFAAEIENHQKQRLFPEGIDFAPTPPAYFLLNLEAGVSIKMKNSRIHLDVLIQNATDRTYRVYLDTWRYYADRPGISATLKISVPISIETH